MPDGTRIQDLDTLGILPNNARFLFIDNDNTAKLSLIAAIADAVKGELGYKTSTGTFLAPYNPTTFSGSNSIFTYNDLPTGTYVGHFRIFRDFSGSESVHDYWFPVSNKTVNFATIKDFLDGAGGAIFIEGRIAVG